MSPGIRLTDKDSGATVDKLIGVQTSPTTKIVQIDINDLVAQLLAGEIGDLIGDLLQGATSLAARVDRVAARMSAGEVVKVACLGDSLTDGEDTTGWTRNPIDGNGDAVGNIDHEATAPNAWPAVLKTVLRAMHGNNSIQVWNAGYSGKRLADGWAYNNFERAIINNPAYGTPDLVFVGFGWNDQTIAGSQVVSFATEMIRLIAKILSYGAVPVFLTCDAAPRNTAGRDNREVSRQIDAVKTAVCSQLGVTLLDVGGALTRWANGNTDGYRQREQQPDYLHWQDKGHALKAGFIAKHFYRDTIHVTNGQRVRAGTWEVALGAGQPDAAIDAYSASNGKYAGNWVFDRSIIGLGSPLLDAWVWCENPEASVVYRGIDGEAASFAAGLTTGNYFELWSPITGMRTRRPPAMGFAIPGAGYRRSDVPALLGDLNWGLNRITYRTGTELSSGTGQGFFGFLDFPPFKSGAPRNALRTFGPVVYRASNGSGNVAMFLPEAEDGSNLWGFEGTNGVEIFVDLKLPVGTGFIYGWTPGFGDVGNVAGDKTFSFLYRSAANTLVLYIGRTVAGAVSFIGGGVATGTFGTADDIKLRIVVDRDVDNQITSVFDGWVTITPAITATVAYSALAPAFGGVLGGLFANRATVTGTVTAEIRAASILL